MKHERFVLAFGLIACSVQAAVKLPAIFGENMVLQQQQPVPVWGWANANEQVTVEFAGQKKSVTAGANGKWMLKLDPLKASATPAVFKVSASNVIALDNVVVGEVWFASGQSNMEWPVAASDNFEKEKVEAKWPLIRHFRAPKNFKSSPQDDVSAKWELTTPESIGGQSAVAYFFGRRIHQSLNVPVGLINSSWGGTRIEPWTPTCGFDDIPAVADIKNRIEMATPVSPVHKKALNDYVGAMNTWLEDAKKREAASLPIETTAPSFPQSLIFPTGGQQQEPTVLYNGMMAGLVPFAIKGAIWYQGCSNNGEGMLYLEKTKALVNGWRKVWNQGDFPYYLVQLAPYNYGAGAEERLPGIWEAQAAVPAAIKNTGYTVINDIGNTKDIHPRNKQDVGLRMANQALNRTYGMKEIAWSGPVYKSFAIEGAKIRITFDCAEGLKTRDNKAPDWFEVAGLDGQYKAADAVIEGQAVMISNAAIGKPLAVRFAWNQLAEPNLVNGLGLPTSAFRCSELPKIDSALAMPELQGFRKVYETDLPVNAKYAAEVPVYSTDNSASAGAFSKVAYVLQLEDNSGSIRYVATLMDAFTTDAKKLGIPHPKSGIKHQMKVTNLTVRSNVEGVPALENSDGGNIEFWPCNYGGGTVLKLEGASPQKYDFDDEPSVDGMYGSMQIHAWKNKTVLFAFNNFNLGAACDIGIGNNTKGENPDYTFMSNGGGYKTRRLTVLVK
jgi:sialate O-acetylesterase